MNAKYGQKIALSSTRQEGGSLTFEKRVNREEKKKEIEFIADDQNGNGSCSE